MFLKRERRTLDGFLPNLDRTLASLSLQELEQRESPAYRAFVRTLFVRYAVARTIDRVTAAAAELLGEMAFVRSFDVTYLPAAARALAFHPPSRTSIAPALTEYLRGAPVSEMNVGLGG